MMRFPAIIYLHDQFIPAIPALLSVIPFLLCLLYHLLGDDANITPVFIAY